MTAKQHTDDYTTRANTLAKPLHDFVVDADGKHHRWYPIRASTGFIVVNCHAVYGKRGEAKLFLPDIGTYTLPIGL